MKFEQLTIVKGKERAIHRKHPWVFSGALKKIPAYLNDGELVELLDYKQNFLGVGFFKNGSIAVSLLSFEPIDNISTFINERIQNAINYRKSVGVETRETNCYRLVFAEGDGMSGLIIDKYADTAVVQIHHPGWLPFLQVIAKSLVASKICKHVYSKPSDKLNLSEEHRGTIAGESTSGIVLENGLQFKIDWQGGQKTGFFLDQRENRKRLADFCKDKEVLNTFSYTGGFSVYALAAGAKRAVSVDISQSAIDLAIENAELNKLGKNHEGIASDVFEYLKQESQQFDVIILDPPAFSKSRRTTHNAVQAYKRLNIAGIKAVKKTGFIFTFSCSQHVDAKLFEDTIRAAAIESGRSVRVVERLGQPADHPANIFHPEGEYLKGLILAVE